MLHKLVRSAAVAAALFGGASAAHAVPITIDANDFPVGQILGNGSAANLLVGTSPAGTEFFINSNGQDVFNNDVDGQNAFFVNPATVLRISGNALAGSDAYQLVSVNFVRAASGAAQAQSVEFRLDKPGPNIAGSVAFGVGATQASLTPANGGYAPTDAFTNTLYRLGQVGAEGIGIASFIVDDGRPAPTVPLPATLPLLASVVAAGALVRRRRLNSIKSEG